MSDLQKNIARLLLEKEAVKIQPDDPFTWTSGIRSPIYCDNRSLLAFPDARKMIVDGFVEVIEREGIEFDAVAGVATGAIALGALLAERFEKPYAYIRPDPRSHGTGKQVEGFRGENAKLLVVEDLFSTAGSSVKAVEAARKEINADVVGILAISTYEFPKAEERLAAADLSEKWWSLTNFTALVGELDIDEAKKSVLLDFAKNPAEWWNSRGE